MPFPITGPQRLAISADSLASFGKFELTDPDGTWRDVTAGLPGSTDDWLKTVVLTDNVNFNAMTLNATLFREKAGTTLSLAPLMQGSPINVDPMTSAYAPMIELVRQWRFSSATVAKGATPGPSDWNVIGTGYVDTIDDALPNSTITVTGRDLGAKLLDTFIVTGTVNGKLYSTPGGTPAETIIQQLLDDWLGPGVVTLYTPVSPLQEIRNFLQQDMSVMDAVNAVAQQFGWVVRYLPDSSGVFRLTLFEPPRAQTVEDWTIGADEYLELPIAQLDITTVRNLVSVRFINVADGSVHIVYSPKTRTSPSIVKYGVRPLPIDMQNGTQINNDTVAQLMADAARADSENPAFTQRFVTYGFWFVTLFDYGKFLANNIQYDTDQFGAVTAYTHTYQNGVLKTQVDCLGKPGAGYRSWLNLAQSRALANAIAANTGASTTTVNADNQLLNFRLIAEDDASFTYDWDNGPDVSEVWGAQQTFSAPVPDDPWDIITAGLLPGFSKPLVITKPDPGTYTFVQVEPRDATLISGPVQRLVASPGLQPLPNGATPQGTVAIDANGDWEASIDGPYQALSFKWLSSTSAFPSDAAVLSGGTLINGRQFDITGGTPLAFGETIYVTVIPFAGTGALAPAGLSVHLRGSYQTYTPSKTVTYSAASFQAVQGGFTLNAGYFNPRVVGAIALPISYNDGCLFLVPVGATLTEVSQELYWNDTGTVLTLEVSDVYLYAVRVDSPGGGGTTILGTAHITNLLGWQTAAIPLSELSSGKAYYVWSNFDLTTHATTSLHDITSALGASFFVTYTMGDPTTTI